MVQVDLTELPLLSKQLTPNAKNLMIQSGSVLMSCSGTIGRTVFAREDMHGLVGSDDLIRMVATDALPAGYLFAFLSSAHAQAMIHQRAYGSVVQHIEPMHIADIPVPVDERVVHDVDVLVLAAAAKRTKAASLLKDAAQHFDGDADFNYPHEHALAVGQAKFTDARQRLDAFYHVGWSVEGPFSNGSVPIASGVSRPGMIPRIYAENGVPFLSGIDAYQLRPRHRDRLMRQAAEASHAFIKAGQILIQRSGQRYGLFGRPAHVTRRMHGWTASEHLLRLDFTSPEMAANAYAFLLSRTGRRALVRTSYGTSIPELNPRQVASLTMPLLRGSVLCDAVEALNLREQADEEEERAIRMVEEWLD